MEMANGLGLPSTLLGIRLAIATDRPSVGRRWRPSPSFPLSSSSLLLPLSPTLSPSCAAARLASFGRMDPIGCCTDAGGGYRQRPKHGEPTGTLLGLNQAWELVRLLQQGRAVRRPSPMHCRPLTLSLSLPLIPASISQICLPLSLETTTQISISLPLGLNIKLKHKIKAKGGRLLEIGSAL